MAAAGPSFEQVALRQQGGMGVFREGWHARVLAQVDVNQQPDVDVGVGDGERQSDQGGFRVGHQAGEHPHADAVPHRRQARDHRL